METGSGESRKRPRHRLLNSLPPLSRQQTAPSPTPKSAMALWEERIAAAALEQDGEAPLADDSDPEEELTDR